MLDRRRRSPVLLVLAFALVCAAPLAVAAGTGLVSGVGLVVDRAETADGPRDLASAGRADDDDGGSPATEGDGSGPEAGGSGGEGADAQDAAGGPPGTGTADIPPSSSTTSTTAPPAPPPTAAPATAAPTSPAPPPTIVVARPAPTRVDQVLALVNQARAAGPGHCGPIQLESHLTAAAQGHSDDMAARNYFSHDTPEGIDFATRIANAGYPGFPAAENIAKGQRTAQQVMSAWMNSPGHRANIENCEYTAIGIGVNTTAWTWTQDFGI